MAGASASAPFLGIGLALRCLVRRGADRHGVARREAFLPGVIDHFVGRRLRRAASYR